MTNFSIFFNQKFSQNFKKVAEKYNVNFQSEDFKTKSTVSKIRFFKSSCQYRDFRARANLKLFPISNYFYENSASMVELEQLFFREIETAAFTYDFNCNLSLNLIIFKRSKGINSKYGSTLCNPI